jgi:hypothetical protein
MTYTILQILYSGCTLLLRGRILDVIWTKVLRVFLLAAHSHLYERILLTPPLPPLPPPHEQKWFETVLCNVNIVYAPEAHIM